MNFHRKIFQNPMKTHRKKKCLTGKKPTKSIKKIPQLILISFSPHPQGIKITVNISENVKINQVNYYEEMILPKNSWNKIKIDSKNTIKKIGYAMVQVHSHILNLTLSYSRHLKSDNYENGTNLGMILFHDTELHLLNVNWPEDAWISIAVTIYDKFSPIPGGCNQENSIEISPILNLVKKNYFFIVDTPAASHSTNYWNETKFCWKTNLTYETYIKIFSYYDFSKETYFSGIRSIGIFENFKKTGGIHRTTKTPGPTLRRMYPMLPGYGIVVTTIVRNLNRSAIYVPIFTYSCSPAFWNKKCDMFGKLTNLC